MKSLLAFSTTVLFTLLFCVEPGAAQSHEDGGSVSNAEAAGQTAPGPAAPSPAASTTETLKMKHAGITMIATGWPVFGGTWLIMAIAGISMASLGGLCENNDEYCERTQKKDAILVAPLVGPIVTASMEMSDYGADLWFAWLEVISSILQIGGLAVAIAGHVIWSRAKAAEKGIKRSGMPFRMIPMFHASRGVAGLSLAFSL